jgi:hypothetical protein
VLPAVIYVIAAVSRENAQEHMATHDWLELMEMGLLVGLTPVKWEGHTALPFALLWCSTVHKAQGNTE